MHGYEAADNGGENSQPILSCIGQGELTDEGLHLSLKGQLGGYMQEDLGDYDKKHIPCSYEYVFDLTWNEFIDRICGGYPFTSRNRFKKEVAEPWYHLSFLNTNFLNQALRGPDQTCNYLIAGDRIGANQCNTNSPEKKDFAWTQPIRACRVRGFFDACGLKLSISGWFGKTVNYGAKIADPPRRFAVEFTCSHEDVPALLGFKMLLKDKYVLARNKDFSP
jgi:hypothetical protein